MAQVNAASLNGHCSVLERVTHDHLDDMAAAMMKFMLIVGMVWHFFRQTSAHRPFLALTAQVPGLWKADIDSAFRRIPLLGDHLWAAGVTYLCGGVAWVALHNAMPFGATSSVYAWHRVGELLCTIARKVLHLPVYRYVDDFFAIGRSVVCSAACLLLGASLCACRPDTIAHAMETFARLVRLLLGSSAISDQKLEYGCQLLILGMKVRGV